MEICLGICLGFAWGLLGHMPKVAWDEFFDRNDWGSCFWPTFCLGSLVKAILVTILLGDLLGPDLVGSVTQGCV